MALALACLVCLVAGAGATALAYEKELQRMALFLSGHDAHSNARMTIEAPGRGFARLARSINALLDAAQRERIADTKRQQAFQRDLSALSHDVRTPLMGAKGRLQLAQDETDAARRDAHLNGAMARIDEATSLINQLFAYTKATDPDLALEIEPVALMSAVIEAVMRHRPRIEAAGWEPEISFEDEGACVLANADSLARIFDNLIDNALKYGTSPLVVRQSAGALTFSNKAANPESIDASRLFERFYRADTARGGAGTGLGLSVAASLAQAMNMSLHAELEGSTLSITLKTPAE